MPTPIVIRRRRGTTAQHASFIGAEGELTIDTTKKTVVVHDGATPGGFSALREPASESGVKYQLAVRDGALVLIEQ
ncbi:MAG: hypothetical protein N2690_00690 [Rhodocyclaceae bacterium]|nr:hypothetical protein [Rhodocyclaceae bacterium]